MRKINDNNGPFSHENGSDETIGREKQSICFGRETKYDQILRKLSRHDTDFDISPYIRRENFLTRFEEKNRDKLPYETLIECLKYGEGLRPYVPIIFNVDHFCYILENFPGRKIKFSASTPEKRIDELCKMAFYDPDPKKPNKKPIWWKEFQIPKKDGNERQIIAPRSTLKGIQRWILHNILMKVEGGVTKYAYGFVKGKSIVDNAKPHVGKKFILNIDIENFFPSIKVERVVYLFRSFGYTWKLSNLFAGLCTYKDFLPQGAPTSPAISNMICRRLDLRLGRFCEKHDLTYTRYADDITISGDYDFLKYKNLIMKIIEDEDFKISHKKLRVTGRGKAQIVTGIVVNEKPNIKREEIRHLRAILYNCRTKGVLSDDRNRDLNFAQRLLGMISFVNMVRPDLAVNFLQEYRSINWDDFIGWRERTLALHYYKDIIRPDSPYANRMKLAEIISESEHGIKWIDKYFSEFGLMSLRQHIKKGIKEVKILTSVYRWRDKIDDFHNFRKIVCEFIEEMKNLGIKCECRVMVDRSSSKEIHDRWIIIDDRACYNIPSTDVIARGQYSSIYREEGKVIPFEEYWQKSLDIVKQYGEIKTALEKLAKGTADIKKS